MEDLEEPPTFLSSGKELHLLMGFSCSRAEPASLTKADTYYLQAAERLLEIHTGDTDKILTYYNGTKVTKTSRCLNLSVLIL